MGLHHTQILPPAGWMGLVWKCANTDLCSKPLGRWAQSIGLVAHPPHPAGHL